MAAIADESFSPVFLCNATAFGFSPRLRADIVLNNLVGHAVLTGDVRVLSAQLPALASRAETVETGSGHSIARSGSLYATAKSSEGSCGRSIR